MSSQAHLNEISNSGSNDFVVDGYHHHSVNHMQHNHHHHNHPQQHTNIIASNTTTSELITPSSVNSISASASATIAAASNNIGPCSCMHQYHHLHHHHIPTTQQQQLQQSYHHQHTNNRLINSGGGGGGGIQGLLNSVANTIPSGTLSGECSIINNGICCGDTIHSPILTNNSIADVNGVGGEIVGNTCIHHPRQSLHSTHSHNNIIDDLSENRQISGETHVAVTVHQQSQQHNSNVQLQQQQQQQHQYQALDLTLEDDDNNCDCNKNNCNNSNNCNQHHLQQQQHNHNNLNTDTTNTDQNSIGLVISNSIVGNCNKNGICSDVDSSNIPSGSENSQVNQKCIHHKKNSHRISVQQRLIMSRDKGIKKSSEDEKDYSSRIEVYSDGADSGVKVTDGGTSEEDQGPPLPPRPPPRSRNLYLHGNAPLSTGVKKYVVWCLISGGCSCLLGTMFLGVYFLLRSYTSTVGYFETVPTFVPATLLILTGLCIITLARRRNRYSFLIKLAGVCGLASSLVCALVTVTTTVLHMSRLQALSECEYSTKAKTCTCYSAPPERPLESDRESVTFVFDSTSDCGLVHGALYSCLRAIFGLSVAGVLVAVFSCMLVYQLLTHERKKMYWEQLELRCRSLYESQHLPTTIPSSQLNGPSIIGGPPLTTINGCRCCEQCHAHRQSTNLTGPAASAWESANRFWAAAALTSGGGQSIQTTAGNFYSPNPGSDELNNMISGSNTNNTTNNGNQNNNQNNTSDNLNNSNNQSNRSTGWSWPKMPWQKNNNNTNTSNSNNTSNSGNVNHNTRLFRQSPSSPDSQYGFSQNPTTVTGVGGIITTSDGTNIMMTTNGIPNQQTSYSIIGGLPYGVWGPPPPYSDPNSPARRPGNGINSINPTTGLLNSSGRYQYIHQNQCPSMLEHQMHQQAQQQSITNLECHQQNNSSSADGNSVMEHFNTSQQQNRNLIKRQTGLKSKDNYENTLSDSDGSRDRFSNSLPVRKMKKRIESLTKNNISSSNNNCKNQSRNNQNVFQPINSSDLEEPEYHEPRNPGDEELNSSPTNISSSSSAGATTNQINSMQQPKCNKRIKTGIDNTAFQGPDSAENNTVHHIEPSTESEVYFADVSSCCNVSVKNDSYYEDANQRPCQDQEIPDSKEETEDYLAQRFGKRENSIRSRLPFPQNTVNSKVSSHSETFDKNQMNLPIINTRQNQIPKDISRQSMCSVDSGEKTDFTDLSPATPCTNNSYLTQQDHVNNFNLTNNNNNTADLKTINDSFIASYPFSSNEQCQEAHRRSTKNLQDMFLAPDAQYEIIKETNQFESTPLTLAFDEELNNSSNTNNFNNQNNNISNNNINSNNNSNNNINNSSSNNNIIKNNKTTSHQIKSPKNLSLTPLNRSNIGANITSIIQNLSSSEAGLLYPDNRISNNSSVTRDNFSDQENHEGKILKIQGHNILNHKKQQSSQQPIPLSNSDNEWSDSSDRRL